MGTERREGTPFTTEGPWWTEDHHTHALEVHRSSDRVTYYVDDEPAVSFSVEQFEDLMQMASTIDYLKQPMEPAHD